MGDNQDQSAGDSAQLAHTPLHELHGELGARMVPFAGFAMPVQYPAGVLTEHLHTRQAAGLFDVSHMGQAFLTGPDFASVARALEALTPGNFAGLGVGRQRYTVLLNQSGGIIDDLMVARSAKAENAAALFLVVNASRKDVDYAHIKAHLPAGVSLTPVEDRALIALQGPKAAVVLARHCPQASDLTFMGAVNTRVAGIECHISRSGYTGEDGYEISVPAAQAADLAKKLLSEPEVAPIGLGARDSLRLEAGLCLYGHDIDEITSPIEANLAWAVAKRRREEANFPGAKRILDEITNGPVRRLVGIQPEGRAPAREGTPVQDMAGADIGIITSGGFGPTAGGPVAMGYVAAEFAAPGTDLHLLVRGVSRPAKTIELPFVAHRYRR
ncbi:MAG: glycine cleavage system aminomethyltransferase GcvT [Alphaproteobacteria bacterium]